MEKTDSNEFNFEESISFLYEITCAKVNMMGHTVSEESEEGRILEESMESCKITTTKTETQQDIINDDKSQKHLQNLHSLLEMYKEKNQEISLQQIMATELENYTLTLSEKLSIMKDEFSTVKDEKKLKEIAVLETHIDKLLYLLKEVIHVSDIKVGLLQKENCQFEHRITDLSQEKSDRDARLKTENDIILKLQTQLSAIQCSLTELAEQYKQVANTSNQEILHFSDKYKEKLEEEKKLTVETETCETRETKTEAKVDEIQKMQLSFLEELKNFNVRSKNMILTLEMIQGQKETLNKDDIVIMENYCGKNLQETLNAYYEDKLKLQKLLMDAKKDYVNQKMLENTEPDKNIDKCKDVYYKTIEERSKYMIEHAQTLINTADAYTENIIVECYLGNAKWMEDMIAECNTEVHTAIKDAQSIVENKMLPTIKKYQNCLDYLKEQNITLHQKLMQNDPNIKFSAILQEYKVAVKNCQTKISECKAIIYNANSQLQILSEKVKWLEEKSAKEVAYLLKQVQKKENFLKDRQK